jgi:hypothetical protein
MRRIPLFILLCLAVVPAAAQAIQLHWSSGAVNLTFTEATRCTLVVQVDSAEVTLPAEWQLLWVADSTQVEVVALDSLEVCAGDTAQVYDVEGPATPEDSTANRWTAQFCSGGSSAAASANYLLDLPAWARGKLKVVALDPADSTSVLESNEAMFNGGVSDPYPASILLASSAHETSELQVAAVGTGLTSVSSVRLTATDGLWSVPLTIVSQTDSTITAVADVPAALPASVLEASSSSEVVSLGSVAADEIETEEISYPDTILFRDPNPAVYPKDFAFFHNVVPSGNSQHPWKGLFHLVYIRHNKNLSGDAQEPCLAHAWSDSLRGWRVDTLAFLPGSGWDALHVWAPSIVQVGNLYYMFYTGVDATRDQRIGYATTALLDTTNTQWERQSSWVYAPNMTAWADTIGLGYSSQLQFRDPFVMTDPDSAGRYLMFVTGEDKKFGSAGRMIVGVARSQPGTLAQWQDRGAYRATDYTHTSIAILESPLVCRDSSGTGAWRIFMTNGLYDSIGSNSQYFITEVPDSSVADTTLASWPDLDNMYTYLGSDGSLLGWAACEHLRVGKSDFFAGYNGDGIAITQAHWDPTTGNFVIGYPSLAGVPGGSPASDVRFYLSRCRPGEPTVRFEVDLPSLVSPRLIIYDIAGRRVRTLAEGQAMQGRHEFQWDCRDLQGAPVASGVYFARLTNAGAPQVLHVPVVR